MVKVSDYVMDFLAKKGVKDVFLVSGGNSMHLLDSLGKHPTLRYICNHHEQASAMSAEGYARITGNFGVCLVSSGPAQTNALTGLMCAWEDSIPVMFISGNCNSTQLKGNSGLRQKGVHEVDILPMVKDVTKMSLRITDPNQIKYDLDLIYDWMMEGRKGPVWIDIPVDIQGMMFDPDTLYSPERIFDKIEFPKKHWNKLEVLFKNSKRPIVLIGGGAISNIDDTLKWATNKHIPIVCTKNAFGYISVNTLGYHGMIGVNGNREANLAIQNSDLVLVLGSRLALPATGYDFSHFAPDAIKVIVDVDAIQIGKSNIVFNLGFNMKVEDFMRKIARLNIRTLDFKRDKAWLDKLTEIDQAIMMNDFFIPDTNYVNSNHFFESLSDCMQDGDILVVDQGAAFYSWSQSFSVQNTISFTNGGFSPMGYGLPAAIGACIAANRPVICVTGDGGFEMNIQELQTIVHYKLPVKIFVFNNQGYGSIKDTQDKFFNGFYVGSDAGSGVTCVDPHKIADAYNIPYYSIRNDRDLDTLERILQGSHPIIVNVMLDPHQKIYPKVMASMDEKGVMIPGKLEDMYPLLDRDVFKNLMKTE